MYVCTHVSNISDATNAHHIVNIKCRNTIKMYRSYRNGRKAIKELLAVAGRTGACKWDAGA